MIFYEVCRRGKRYDDRPFGRVVLQTDNRERADKVFEREYMKLHSGSVYLLADGFVARQFGAGWNRTRW